MSLADSFPHPHVMPDDRLLRHIAEQTADMREAQRAFFRLRKAGEDANHELSRSRMLERVVDGAIAEWRRRLSGDTTRQTTLFPGEPHGQEETQ